MKSPFVSIIIPCYNEGETFEKSVWKIVSVLAKNKILGEIIFVEDKSADETAMKIGGLLAEISKFKFKTRAIFHTKNQGRGKSVSDGLLISRGEICGYLDVDLEVPAEYIPIFVSEIKKGADMVVGKRFYEGEGLKTIPRFLASKIYSAAIHSMFRIPIDDTEAGYKFFERKKILPVVRKTRDKHWFWDTEICVRAYRDKLKITQVPVIFKRRLDKKSTVRLVPDTIAYIFALLRFKFASK